MAGSQPQNERAQVNCYVDEREKRVFEAHAAVNDDSLSTWVAEACREQVRRENVATEADHLEIQHRLYTAIEQVGDEISEDIRDALAPAVAEAVIRSLAAADVIDPNATAVDPREVEDSTTSDAAGVFDDADRPELPTED